MTKEDKKLLLKDLSGRLPYGVKIEVDEAFGSKDVVVLDCFYLNRVKSRLYIMKPYLFPLSSLTAKQKQELWDMGWAYILGTLSNERIEFRTHFDCRDLIDFFNENHIDYRGLIEKGLAIDCTNLNIY